MNKKSVSNSAFFTPRVVIGLAFCSIGLFLALLAFALYPGGNAFARQNQSAPQGIAQPSVPVLEATLTVDQELQLAAQPVFETDLPVNGTIDMAALGLHPLPFPLA